MDFSELVRTIPRTGVLGISGFGGAGKSTLARRISALTGAPVVGVDSFFKHTDFDACPDWECIDWMRLRDEVLVPFEAGARSISFREFDWEKNRLGAARTLSAESGLLILEGVRLFGSPIQPHITTCIWIDCPLDVAIARGKERDKSEYGVDNDELWDGVWRQNDLAYERVCNPRAMADIVVDYRNLDDFPSQS